MGSAFAIEPLHGADPRDVVTFLMWPRRNVQADLVCHQAHPDCGVEYPHPMGECGRFVPPPPGAQEK